MPEQNIEEIVTDNNSEDAVSQTAVPEQIHSEVEIKLPKNFTYNINIQPFERKITQGLKYNLRNNKASVNVDTDFESYNADAELSIEGENGSIDAKVTDNNGNISASITAGGNMQAGNLYLEADGNYTLNEEGASEHTLNLNASSDIKSCKLTANIHNDKTDTSLGINLRKPLLRRDNNPNSAEAEYQEAKEELLQSGDRFNLSFKVGYSNEDNGFYTSNSAMINFGKEYFLNLKMDKSRFAESYDVKADIKKVNVEYKYTNTTPRDDIRSDVHGVDFVYKGKKNIYSANWSLETKYPDSKTTNRNIGFGGKVSLNRTEYGEFNSGFNGEIEACITQQGYKFALDGAFNKYGDGGKNSNDFLVSSVSMLEKDDSGTTFETGLFGALRFNNCRTIVEPRTIFNVKKDSNGQVARTYTNGIGIYQQVGRNFEDACIYAKGEYVLRKGGENPSFMELNAGFRKKATPKLTANAEMTLHSEKGFSGNIGLAYHF